MGAEQHKFTNDLPMNPRKDKAIPAEYQVCYQKWLADPNFLQNLLHENKQIAGSILLFFPTARSSYQDFLQMVSYLRRYDPPIQKSQYASYNVHHTTLLDRFFMLILNLNRFEQLDEIKVTPVQMEQLFLELMRLFLPNPRKGFINKLLGFIGFKDVKQATLKQYSASLRQFLPHIQKHIKDYYTLKFFNMQQNAYLLRKFHSQILVEDAVLLSMKIAQITNPEIRLLYEPRSCGMSFHSIQKNILGYTGPWLMAIEHVEKDNQGKSHVHRFGTYQSGPILDLNSFQGDYRGFLFSVQPKIKVMSADKGSGASQFFYISNQDQRFTKQRRGIGFGGDINKQHFKLWIDQDLDKSTVYNGNDSTYGFGSLVDASTTQLNITKIQIWALGTATDLNNLEEYWESRNVQIQKRRKVNKGEFLAGDNSLLFQKTFGFRDQVYGQINKKQQEHPSSKSTEHHSQPKHQH